MLCKRQMNEFHGECHGAWAEVASVGGMLCEYKTFSKLKITKTQREKKMSIHLAYNGCNDKTISLIKGSTGDNLSVTERGRQQQTG